MCTVSHAEQEFEQIHREEKTGEKRPERDEDRDRQTDLSHGLLLFGPLSRCHQKQFLFVNVLF